MHLRISLLLRTAALVATLLFASIPGLAQDKPGADAAYDPRREFFALANGRTEFEVSDPDRLPKPLTLVLEQLQCRYKADIKGAPVRFISIERQRLAIVACSRGISGSNRVFDLGNLEKPRQLEFPYYAWRGGFSSTPEPGIITWNKEAGLLEAESSSDLACSGRGRHIYRLSKDEGRFSPTFVIVRIQIQKDECRQKDWETIWEASPWPDLR